MLLTFDMGLISPRLNVSGGILIQKGHHRLHGFCVARHFLIAFLDNIFIGAVRSPAVAQHALCKWNL